MIIAPKHTGTSLEPDAIRKIAHPLDDGPECLDTLIEAIGDAKVVLLGEASHGTHEYYLWRSRISKRLIEEKGFNFIAVEGDWPDSYQLNRYIKGYADSGTSAENVLNNFNRWPTWMWANWEIVALAEWLRKNNEKRPRNKRTGFYGLDVYSLWESLDAIQRYLREKDLGTLQLADDVFECFEPYRASEGQTYAHASFLTPVSCEYEVIDLLKEIRKRMPLYNTDPEAVFSVEQNALVVSNAEKYYRALLYGGARTWNLRDSHMFETLNRLLKFHGPDARAIIWEHNTHVGDARYTDMAEQGMFNLGELVRRDYNAGDTFLLGFGSYEGSVIAAKRWSAGMQETFLPPAIAGSWEERLHSTGMDRLMLLSSELEPVYPDDLPLKHRAVGVVYNPEAERFGNYVPSIMPQRYDAFIYLDYTTALHPLKIIPDGTQMPETYPWGV